MHPLNLVSLKQLQNPLEKDYSQINFEVENTVGQFFLVIYFTLTIASYFKL